ncbi:hypothetical protein QUF70_05860 [Desulfobacterales bacterium HSG17]|nr:hypothetical protein [Desulfobacterales bacterium HSG17]
MTLQREPITLHGLYISSLFLILVVLLGTSISHSSWYDGDDFGYLDMVTINDTLYENLDSREIVFYTEDLRDRDGKVEIKGILESEKKGLKPSDLIVQISLDGGNSWKDATGSSRWSFIFEPEPERYYDLSIQVIQRKSERLNQYQLGDFILKTGIAALEDQLNGQATIALGWLAQFVPSEFKKPGTDELLLTVSNLQVAGNIITSGSVTFDQEIDFTVAGTRFTLTSVTFSSDGATADGTVTLPDIILPSAPTLDFSALKFTHSGINHELDVVKTTDPVKNINIISGPYGVTAVFNALAVNIDTSLPQPVSLTKLKGGITLGSGYNNLKIPNLKLLENQLLSFGYSAISASANQEIQQTVETVTKLVIPGTEFGLDDIAGIINLTDKSVSLSGSFQFPESLGSDFVELPAEKPLVLSRQGISTSSDLVFDSGNLPGITFSGFPTSLTRLALSLADNIPSGSLAGQLTLTNFASLKLDIEADIDKTGLTDLKMAALPEDETHTFNLAGFADLSLSRIELSYENSNFEVNMDGTITPVNDAISSIQGIGEKLVFTGLSIGEDAISLASDLEGWHDISGASFGLEGASISIIQYGIGVDNNLFWVGLKGRASLGGSEAEASARIFHDGTTAIDGIDLTNLYFAFGDFFLKMVRDTIAEDGTIPSQTLAQIGGLPDALIKKLPAGVLNSANELEVLLNGFKVDVANRLVSLGTVDYTPDSPIDVTFGPGTLQLSGLNFTPYSASIQGSIALDGLGLPIGDLPFTDLYLGADGIAGDIDLVGDTGTRSVTIMEGEFGFGVNLNALSVSVDTRRQLTKMIRLKTFSGSLFFGSGLGNIEIPDLSLRSGNILSWGKNSATEAHGSLARLILPGNIFSIGDLGGTLDLMNNALSFSGTLFLPPSMGSISLTIPADQPLTLSAENGLSTSGPLIFDPGNLPAMPLAHIDTTLTGLSLGLINGDITGSLSGDLNFERFGGLKIAVNADIDKTGLKELKIDTGKLKANFDLAGFASLNLDTAKAGFKNENFYVQIDGDITPTHPLFTDYQKKVEFKGLRIFKSGLGFAGNMAEWHNLEEASIAINAANVALEQYGIGIHNQRLWFGLKGKADYLGNGVDLTAKIFQDGTFEISDFGFEGLSLSLGDFKLRTSAKAIEGVISGEGFINAGFLSKYIPSEMKDPLTGELKVNFENLGIDLNAQTITSGKVVLDFTDKPITPDFDIFSAKIHSVEFGFDGASIDGDLTLKSLAGIKLPTPTTDLRLTDIELSPAGFAGSISYDAGRTPVLIPILTGDYGITLALSQLTLAVDTQKTDLSDKLKLTDLDGGIELGTGYDLEQPLNDLRLLADGAITWGATALSNATGITEEAQKEAQKQADKLRSGLSFAIPNTSFSMKNLMGRLYLNDRKMAIWGNVSLPEELGGGSIGLSSQNALVLSENGVSTTGQVFIDPGTLGHSLKLGGFGADVSAFSFGVNNNIISGSIAARLKLARFDNLPISVIATLGSQGIDALDVTAEELEESFSIAGFADLMLTKIGGGFENGNGFVTLDGTLTLDHDKVKDLGQTFDFFNLMVSPTTLSLPEMAQSFDIDGVSFSVGDDALAMSLLKYGFLVKDNLFWISLAGEVSMLGNSLEASAKLSHKGNFVFDRLGADNLTIAIGPDFTLKGSFDFVDGHIAEAVGGLHLGGLMDSIGSEFKNQFNELPVEVADLDFEMINDIPVLTQGTITYAPGQSISLTNDLFTASFTGITVGVRNGTFFGDLDGLQIDFTTGILAGLEGLSISNIRLAGNGISGDVTWTDTDGKTIAVVNHTTHGIDAQLTSIGIHFDTSNAFEKMVSINSIVGKLSFGTGYNAPDLNPLLSFDPISNNYGFSAINASLTLVDGIKLKDFSGAVSFADESIRFDGSLLIPFGGGSGENIVLGVTDWKINSDGFHGGVSTQNVNLDALGFPATLTDASLVFDGFGIASASLGLDITLEKFFNLQFAAQLALDNTGVSSWSVDGQTNASISADAGFAELTVKDLGAGYTSEDGLYFTLNTEIAMKEDAALSALPDDFSLSGIEVYTDKMKINNLGVLQELNYTTTLAGIDLSLKKLGFGYQEGAGLSLKVEGDLNIAGLAKAGAIAEIYTNKIEFTGVELDIKKPAFEMFGDLELDDNRFKAALEVSVAGSFDGMSGLLEIGTGETANSSSFVYWQVQLSIPSVIPLSPLPLNVYSLGGGIAYHMRVVPTAEGAEFYADESTLLSLTALVNLGTTDNAESWYGEFALTIDTTSRVVLVGKSWIMEGRSPEVPAHITASIELGGSPSLFHLNARLNFSKKVNDTDVVAANGQVDILFAQNDWHIYFGSKERPLEATVLHFLHGQGYLQIDQSGLAMGVKKEFNLQGSAWIFYGKLYGGGEVDLAAGVYPFYIDVRGKLWVGLEAGVLAGGDEYEIFNAYAELSGRFKAPPVYIGLKGKVEYSLLMGLYEDTWEVTFTYPDNPPAGVADQGIESMPLIAFSLPENGATKISRVGSIEITTTLPIMTPFQYDDGNWYILMVNKQHTNDGGYVDFRNRQETWDHSLNLYHRLTHANRVAQVVGGRMGSMKLQYTPVSALEYGKEYTYRAQFSLCRWDSQGSKPRVFETWKVRDEIKRESLDVSFIASSEDVSFREGLYEVYPKRSTRPVYSDTEIYLVTKAVHDGEMWNSILKTAKADFQVVDAGDNIVPGHIEGGLLSYDAQEGSMRYMNRFIPDAPLKPVRMVENLVTGVSLPAVILADGNYDNPFTHVPSGMQQTGAPTQGMSVTALGQNDLQAEQPSHSVNNKGTINPKVSGVKKAGRINGRPEAQTRENQEPPETYRWFWNGKHLIRVIKNGQTLEKVFTSKFTIESPASNEDSIPFESTAEVVSQSVTNPHLYVNYTVDPDAFSQGVAEARERIIFNGVRDIFWANMALEPMSVPIITIGPDFQPQVTYETRNVCGQFASPQDIPIEAAAFLPSTWDAVRDLPIQLQWGIYTEAMLGCQVLESQVEELEQQFNTAKQAIFKQYSVVDFRSIELRFSTQAPVNWNEVTFEVMVNPRFNGPVYPPEMNRVSGFLDLMAKVSHTFKPGEYIVRSQAGSLDHVLELSTRDTDNFNGQATVGYIAVGLSRPLTLESIGQVKMYDRSIQIGETEEGQAESEGYMLKQGRILYEGIITDLKTSRPASDSHSDKLMHNGVEYY